MRLIKDRKNIFLIKNSIISSILIISFFVITSGDVTSGDETENLPPGDFLILKDFQPWVLPFWQYFTDEFELYNLHFYEGHSAMYVGELDVGDHWFIEAGPFDVHYARPLYLALIWNQRFHYEVNNVSETDKENAIGYAESMIGRMYQHRNQSKYNHYDPTEIIQPLPGEEKECFQIQFHCIPKFTCTELIWAAYIHETDLAISIESSRAVTSSPCSHRPYVRISRIRPSP